MLLGSLPVQETFSGKVLIDTRDAERMLTRISEILVVCLCIFSIICVYLVVHMHESL